MATPRPRRIRTAANVLDLLTAEMERVRAHPDLNPIARGRSLAELSRAALDAIAANDEMRRRRQGKDLGAAVRFFLPAPPHSLQSTPGKGEEKSS